MNLKEVEKHVKFDIIFNLLIYIGIGICLILSIIVILATPAKAASNNINSYSHSTCGTSMGSGSYYGAFQNGTCYSRAIGTTYSGQANLVGFWLNYNFQAGKYYTITINFKDNDLLSSTIVDVVRVVDVANNRNEWSSSYNFISKKQFKVYFLAPNNTSSLAFSLASGSGDPITGVSNYGISSIYLEDNDNSDEIINANNQNTQNIITNNNSNSEQTQNVIVNTGNSILNQLSNLCGNFFNPKAQPFESNNVGNYSSTNDSVSWYASAAWSRNTYSLTLEKNTTYYVKGNITNSDNADTFITLTDTSYNVLGQQSYTGTNGTFNFSFNTQNSTNVYVILYGSTNNSFNSVTFSNIIISKQDINYCQFGSYTQSKLDDIGAILGGLTDKQQQSNTIQQNEYNYLTDDTDPSVNTGEINNVIGQVQVQDPLNYLLTLPLNLLTKLNTVISSGTCSRASFGELYGTEIYLPCINFENYLGSSLWGTIDTIVGIGLLVVILKKFYDTISNILSLGKEEEIRKGMELPTPMEFLAQILGGGK